ncbi:hypothetical protein LMG26845_06230 [Achromobacter insuavis]|uniref:Uncharacterized protein n=1 Tax=Achromobacter insuavis TaxID=1287735 RepID=A0A6J5BZS5_9BURK|nr:hypothetical protein LMG26845_06230 [Achromobacter insuavis]
MMAAALEGGASVFAGMRACAVALALACVMAAAAPLPATGLPATAGRDSGSVRATTTGNSAVS